MNATASGKKSFAVLFRHYRLWLVAGLVLVAECAAQQEPASVAAAISVNLLANLATNGLVPSSAQVRVDNAPALVINIAPGQDPYPGITLRPATGNWDFTGRGHVDARVANLGSNRLTVCLRVDNPGPSQDRPWNTEMCVIKPGTTGTVRVWFGYSNGKAGYALKPAAVIRALIFTGKSEQPQAFRVEAVEAGGAPGEQPLVDPNAVRIVPPAGNLFGTGIATQVVTTASLQIKPPVGRWDLRDYLEVRVVVKNTGTTFVTPRVRLESNGGPSDWIASATPVTPGTTQEIVVPFAAAVPWQIRPSTNTAGKLDCVPGTGTRLTSDAVAGITITPPLPVQSIRASLPPIPVVPEWLGKRPPVDGDWTLTFADEFDGREINTNVWNVVGENWYDKKSHYSRDNVIVGDGVARLRYEKKRGWHNDDPGYKAHPGALTGETDYATGYLDTFGKWTQTYGYFESRLKLPPAPGLGPAFWTMPDRGPKVVPLGKRGSTGDGGMEFDIMEQLSRWGRYRYNIAMHWDGYGVDHKSAGTSTIYVQPDKDGFITCGLLWTPGVAVYYCNGREVLRWEDPRVASVPADLMFTLPCGGWDNDAVVDAKLPVDFVIDYVRVWQRKDLQGKPVPGR